MPSIIMIYGIPSSNTLHIWYNKSYLDDFGGGSVDWYCIATKVRSEIQADNHLQRQGYETYMPMIDGEPALPGYLFLHYCSSKLFSPINSTRGVIKAVGTSTGPLVIPDWVIDGVKKFTYSPLVPYPVGTTVIVKKGPLKTQRALVESVKGDRIYVVMRLAGQNQRYKFESNDIEAA